MSTKTISVRLEAYERLKRAKQDPSESFSEVIMRAHWPTEPVNAAGYLSLIRERGPLYGVKEVAAVDRAKRADRPPRDKWTTA